MKEIKVGKERKGKEKEKESKEMLAVQKGCVKFVPRSKVEEQVHEKIDA